MTALRRELVAAAVAVVLCACPAVPDPQNPQNPQNPQPVPEDSIPVENLRTVCAADNGTVLTVRWTNRYLLPSGVVEQSDGETPTVRVDSHGTYTSLQAQTTGTGHMVFENLPPTAPVLVCRGVDCVYTCQREVDLGKDLFGRKFPAWKPPGHGVTLTLESLEPWRGSTDALQASVPNLRYTPPLHVYPPEEASTSSVTLTTGSRDLGSVLTITPVPEFQAAEGDTIVVQQVRKQTLEVRDEQGSATTLQSWSALRAGLLSSYPDSGYSEQHLVMQTPPTATVSFRVDAAPLAALLPEMGPGVTPTSLWGHVRAARRQESAVAWQLDVPQLSVQSSQWGIPQGQTFSYGLTSTEPTRVLEVEASASSSNYLYKPSVGWRRELKEGVGEELRPEVGPVQDLRVNGLRDSSRTRRSQPLLLSWAAPSLGEAHQYEVLFYYAEPKNLRRVLVLRLVTTERAVHLPPEYGLSRVNGAFSCIVRSVYRPGSDPEQSPLRESVPSSWADRVSAAVNVD
jgi:hypothetical protein